jgi:hypothetical protein
MRDHVRCHSVLSHGCFSSVITDYSKFHPATNAHDKLGRFLINSEITPVYTQKLWVVNPVGQQSGHLHFFNHNNSSKHAELSLIGHYMWGRWSNVSVRELQSTCWASSSNFAYSYLIGSTPLRNVIPPP